MGAAALHVVTFPLRHPAVWAWPAAAWLTLYASRNQLAPELALESYYVPALGLALLGCLPSFFARRPRRARVPQTPFIPRRVLGWLTVALLLCATAVRIWRVWDWPPNGIGFEEFQIAARGDVGPDWVRNFLIEYSYPGEHTLTAYAISVAFAFFGTGFLEMRLPFIVAGILCPLLLYAVCRRLVSWEVSLFAVALFAVSWWQIAASRVADEIFFPMWTELAVLWLLLHFEDTGRSWAAFLLALLSGLLIYEYTSYHLVVPVVIGYLLARVVLFVFRARDPMVARRRQSDRGVSHLRLGRGGDGARVGDRRALPAREGHPKRHGVVFQRWHWRARERPGRSPGCAVLAGATPLLSREEVGTTPAGGVLAGARGILPLPRHR